MCIHLDEPALTYRDISGQFKPSSYPILHCSIKSHPSSKPIIPHISHQYSVACSPYDHRQAGSDGSGIQIFDRFNVKPMQAQGKEKEHGLTMCQLCNVNFADRGEHIASSGHAARYNQWMENDVNRIIRERQAVIEVEHANLERSEAEASTALANMSTSICKLRSS
jgi:hypothetical protein